MKHTHDEEQPLAPEVMASLRDRTPSRGVQDRTLRALRDDGLFRVDAGEHGPRLNLSAPGRVNAWASAARAIAAVLIFAAGIGGGSWYAHHDATGRVTATTAPARIQNAAQAYVAALALANADSGTAHAAALASFRVVAVQMARIARDDRLGLAARYAVLDSARVSPVSRQDKGGGLLWY